MEVKGEATAAVEHARPPWKPIVLPVEHGGWGFLVEPLLVGGLIAPSSAGGAIAVAAVGAFLVRHPLKLALGDGRRRKWYPRTSVAWGAAAAWLLSAGLLLGLSVALAGTTHLWPLAVGIPLASVQLLFDLKGRGRELVPEIAGALALAVTAPAMLVAGGLGPDLAALVFGALSLRAATAILYVRCRLRRTRGVSASRVPPVMAHVVSLLTVTILAILRLGPWLAVLAFGVLLARTIHGLSVRRAPLPPRRIGFQELGFGLATTLLVALGVRLSL